MSTRAESASSNQASSLTDLAFAHVSVEELWTEALIGAAPIGLSDALAYSLATKGKGIRPAIVLESAKYGPRPGIPTVRRAATAIELLHVATMMHDDVVDRAELRRGVQSVATQYGIATATVGGIWLLARFVETITGFGPSLAVGASECIVQMCAGQMLEVQDMFNVERTPKRYLDAAMGKTAALFEFSARLGAELAGASDETIERLRRYGRELGLAFQIADDVLDLVAGDEATGKSPGNDLRQGVYTLPVIYSLQSEPKLRSLLSRVPEMGELPTLLALVDESGGIGHACEDCLEHVAAAKTAVEQVGDADVLANIADLVAGPCEELRI